MACSPKGICFTNNSLTETSAFCTHILRTHPCSLFLAA